MYIKIPVRMLHEAVSTDEILFFANRWTTWMYFDLMRELSKTLGYEKGMYEEGMSIDEAYDEAQKFGLTFQTWRLIKNDIPDDEWDWWDNQEDNWVEALEQKLKLIGTDHDVNDL